jgi:hypothetical protein
MGLMVTRHGYPEKAILAACPPTLNREERQSLFKTRSKASCFTCPALTPEKQAGTACLVRLKVRTNNEVEVLIGQTLAVRS